MHGRTRDQQYGGHAEYDTIAAIKADLAIPVVANGDIDSPDKAAQVLRHTRCDAVMVGRAAQEQAGAARRVRTEFKTLEAAAIGTGHDVFQQGHRVGLAVGEYVLQRGAQIAHAVCGRVVRIVWKHLEQAAAENRPAGERGGEVGIAAGGDGVVRRIRQQDHHQPRKLLEQQAEIHRCSGPGSVARRLLRRGCIGNAGDGVRRVERIHSEASRRSARSMGWRCAGPSARRNFDDSALRARGVARTPFAGAKAAPGTSGG